MKRAARKKMSFGRLLSTALAGLFFCSLLVSFIENQVEIASKRQELDSAAEQRAAQEAAVMELERMLQDGTPDEIIERIARNQGYIRPGEQVFVDTSGK